MSCPCGFGIGNPLSQDNSEILNALGMKSISELLAYRDMPLDKLGALVDHRIPVVLVAGDSDQVVPYCENGIFLQRAYKDAGVEILPVVMHGTRDIIKKNYLVNWRNVLSISVLPPISTEQIASMEVSEVSEMTHKMMCEEYEKIMDEEASRENEDNV